MACDPRFIPYGGFCYSVLRTRPGETLSEDIDSYGFDLRQFGYNSAGDLKAVLCPYWQRTTHGTVRCEFLNFECVDADTEGARQLAEAYFGGSEAVATHTEYSWELPDQLKICGVHDDWLQDVALDTPEELEELQPIFLEELAGWLSWALTDQHWKEREELHAIVTHFRRRFGDDLSYERLLEVIDALPS